MKPTITIEIPVDSEPFVRRLLALQQELQAVALSAPDGTVLDACEAAILDKARDLPASILAHAIAHRVEEVEKKGRRSAPAAAVGSRKIAASPPGSTSPPSV